MTIRTLFEYLLFSRSAVERIARSKWPLVAGFLLVLSGGLARYYDNAYLPAEWTVLLRGVGVSVINSFFIFLLACAFVATPEMWKGFGRRYLVFLGLFWLMAPMAWLYGIPYERFLSPVEAVRANSWTLALVSIWRVLLAARVLSILLGVGWISMTLPVLLFSDAAMLVASVMMPQPVVDFMGGLQMTEVEKEISLSAFHTRMLSMLALPVLFVATLVAASVTKRRVPLPLERTGERPLGLLVFSLLALLAWVPAAVAFSSEQSRRHRVETAMRDGRVGVALEAMSEHERSEFPPVWDPPPRLLYGEETPPISKVREAIARSRPKEWVAELYIAKSWRDFARRAGLMYGEATIDVVLDRLVYREDLDREPLRFHLRHDHRLSDSDRERLRKAIGDGEK